MTKPQSLRKSDYLTKRSAPERLLFGAFFGGVRVMTDLISVVHSFGEAHHILHMNLFDAPLGCSYHASVIGLQKTSRPAGLS